MAHDDCWTICALVDIIAIVDVSVTLMIAADGRTTAASKLSKTTSMKIETDFPSMIFPNFQGGIAGNARFRSALASILSNLSTTCPSLIYL